MKNVIFSLVAVAALALGGVFTSTAEAGNGHGGYGGHGGGWGGGYGGGFAPGGCYTPPRPCYRPPVYCPPVYNPPCYRPPCYTPPCFPRW